MWYCSSNYRTDAIKVDLSGSEDKLLSDWYSEQNKDVTDLPVVESSPEILACTVLSRLYNVDVEPAVLALGNNLDVEYQKLTGRHLVAGETLFALRDTLGLSLDIAVVRSSKVRRALASSTCDLTQLQSIIDNKLFEQAAPYLKKVLDHRWTKLLELEDSRIINNSGSYVYVRGDSEHVLHNVIGHQSNDIVRLNLLCSEHEFDLLLKRWRRYMKQVQSTSTL